MDPLVELARRGVEAAARNRRPLTSVPEDLAQKMETAPRACFVSLHDSRGELRGCIGTLEPACDSLGLEILHNAYSAAIKDRRFSPLVAEELEGLKVKVDVLSPLEPIAGPESLDPRHYGVVVSTADGRRGVLLPDLDGVDRVDQQLDIARRKAGIRAGEGVRLHRFSVARHS
jgi:AmmeMemoRadiSam system protein A